MKKFGLQLYTVRRELSEDGALEVMKKIKELGYSYVQVAGDISNIERIGTLAKEVGLDVVGSATSVDEIFDNFDAAVKAHKSIGAFDIGVSSSFKSVDEVREFINKANALADRLSEYGLSFSYHNHSHEFVTLENGKCAYDMLIDGIKSKNAYFMPDTYWIQHGGADVRYYIDKLKGRIKILHLKDAKMTSNGMTFAEIGNGNLWWEGILESAARSGVQYYVVEQDKCDGAPIDSVKISAEYLKKI